MEVLSETTEKSTITRELPNSFYRAIESIPVEFEGETRARALAEQINGIPLRERLLVRELFGELARHMVTVNASDLDVGGPAAQGKSWFRVDGHKRPNPAFGTMTLDETDVILLTLLAPIQQNYLFEHQGIDFGYGLDTSDGSQPRRFRATIYFDNRHLALSLRMLAWQPRALHSLGFHPQIERGLMFRYVRDGLTLFTGVTGSGKSTSLDAVIDANNNDIEAHILVVAQPLEYVHESKKCIVRQREVGTDVTSFVDGMIQGMRQDPDIVVVGEMRSPETIMTAMELADTGHKVFSTLHTGSAIESIARIIAEYPQGEQDRVRHRLADVLRCIISQKLLPGVSGGRILAKEVLWMTTPARAAIKNDNANEIYQMMWQGRDRGMVTLEQDLFRLLRSGKILPDVAMGYANNKRRLLELMGK